MKWMQFLTPVKSFDADEARNFIRNLNQDDFTMLDVRQPGEYEGGHIPGAKLIPLPDLPGRMKELDPKTPTIVYCAVGGRSRVAAQMLAGQGFDDVYNLSGGFKAWNVEAAFGEEMKGLELFSGMETPENTLLVAYSLEQGLREFYLSMIPKVNNPDAKKLFESLSAIELKHQEHILEAYAHMTRQAQSREEFEQRVTTQAMEGGLTTEEYGRMFHTDWESTTDIVSLAMSIEAQALDLYTRAAGRTQNPESRKVLMQIAEEERSHLSQLGKLLE
jgi:sulfur-carrier protein adenylyltransferase/sulfurtransferase